MPDKSQPTPDLMLALPGHHLIALEGRDAATFAQAQFMNDVNGLQPGQWHWNGWLTPKGRVIALFALLKWSDQQLWLLLPDAELLTLAEALKRFVFRSKVAIAVRDDLHAEAMFDLPAVARGNNFDGDETRGVELDMGAEGGSRCLRIGRGNGDVVANDDFVARWNMFDLEHGLPRLDASQAEHWTPQQLSLERLRGFSVKKGCYPGQEIVARTHFLGKAKRGLVLLEGDAAMAAGDEVRGGDTALGSVIAGVDVDRRHLALAVLPLERESTPLKVADQPVYEVPLKDGLAR